LEKIKICFSNKSIQNIFLLLSVAFLALALEPGISIAQEEELRGKTVNINTATVKQFMEVPLITRELAERIVEYREENGDFQVIEELLQVDGFNRELLRKIKGFLFLEGIGGDECSC
jgi:competence ComEA-like helix-hairpin-helix protein